MVITTANVSLLVSQTAMLTMLKTICIYVLLTVSMVLSIGFFYNLFVYQMRM